MELESLTAITPIDGRYRSKVEELAPFFSEFGLIRYRTWVEVEYFIALEKAGIVDLKGARPDWQDKIRQIYLNFSLQDGKRVKEIEAVTNHDVKAVEYFLKEQFLKIDPVLDSKKEFIHFGLTSQDINNTATPMLLRDALQEVTFVALDQTVAELKRLASSWEGISMLARTHGQPASPTSLGKEIRVFEVRLENQLNSLKSLSYPAKFGGATGNFNAHVVAYPDRDWHAFAKEFVEESLGLNRSFPTTQIEHYDGLAAIFDNIKRINVLLTDLCVDSWMYISMDYFSQKTLANEVGSSAMPHKVNPIDFENAEGNFGLANALLEFLSRSLPVSRLQRDLTDSTILRNIGTALAHTHIAVKSLLKGLGKLEVNREKIAADLDKNWAVVAEAIQTILRREGYPNPYEQLKALTRGKKLVDAELIRDYIESLDVPEAIKAELRVITPSNYIGK
ncbi:MAG: adenylosuccinate lyase [Bacteroidia bacterium]|nr:adenylosuccinate lyase [Bacteroidia bacterium]